MDAKEAIRYMVKQKVDCATNYGDNRVMECYRMAIEALEKQIAKEPLNENSWHYYCPQCKKEITVLFFNVEKMSHEQKPSNFCANCGQAIKNVKE